MSKEIDTKDGAIDPAAYLLADYIRNNKPKLSDFKNIVDSGVYQHFKGGIYVVDGVGKHSETGEELVIYRNDNGDIWLRPKNMFVEKTEHNGSLVERFKLLKKMVFCRIKPSSILKE